MFPNHSFLIFSQLLYFQYESNVSVDQCKTVVFLFKRNILKKKTLLINSYNFQLNSKL